MEPFLYLTCLVELFRQNFSYGWFLFLFYNCFFNFLVQCRFYWLSSQLSCLIVGLNNSPFNLMIWTETMQLMVSWGAKEALHSHFPCTNLLKTKDQAHISCNGFGRLVLSFISRKVIFLWLSVFILSPHISSYVC